MRAPGNISAVHIGKAIRRPDISRAGLKTAYVKTPISTPVTIHALGIEGDEQANLRVHGGLEKAVYGYPVSNYAGWRADMPDLADRFVAGAMGENLVITGQDESTIHIGDIIRCGTALLQVSQIREPCSTFAAVLGTSRVARAMTRSGRCGWYYRVLEPGMVAAGDRHAITERPNPDWPISRFAIFAAGKGATIEALQQLVSLPGLTLAWQRKAAQVLAGQRDV